MRTALRAQSSDRHGKLDEAFKLHRFNADWRDLKSWITDMTSVIESDELVKDVAGAEAAVERHNEHKAEISSREDSFNACVTEGRNLVNLGLPNSAEIADKVSELERAHDDLNLWEGKRVQHEQCMDLQLCYRDAEQVDSWMAKQEMAIQSKDVGDSLDSVEALSRKHENIEKSLATEEKKIKQLNDSAANLIDKGHYATPQLHDLQKALLGRLEGLKNDSAARRKLLEDSKNYQLFDRDADEIEAWISDKLRSASDENYKDPTNLQTKLQKHQNFEGEIQANQDQIDMLKKTGNDLLSADHFNSHEIKTRLDQIDDSWAKLLNAMSVKNKKLDQANRQQQFLRNADDVDMWLNELAAQISSDDVGRDLNGVINAQKRHNQTEAEFNGYRDRIDALKAQVDGFVAEDHFDTPIIQAKQAQIVQRYNEMTDPLKNRSTKLKDAYDLNQFLRDVEDEEDWIREKEPVAGSTNVAKLLSSVRKSDANPKKKRDWINRERILCLGSRGVSYIGRHLMKDLLKMMPHSRTDSKLDTKKNLSQINELAEVINVNKVLFFEARKRKDLYLWLSCAPNGPSAKFLVENIHTTAELKLTGNCLKSSRPILSFDESFESQPYLSLLKELFVQSFGTPNQHPRSQPYIDKVFALTTFNNRIWFRCYQIAEESGALVEVGPRFSLNLIRIFSGSFCGSVLYSNPHYVSPNAVRRALLNARSDKYCSRVDSKLKTESAKANRTQTYEFDPLDEVFE